MRHIDGLSCDAEAHTLLAYSGESTDGRTFQVTSRELRLDDGVRTQVSTNNSTAHMGDELFTAASTLDCAAL